MPGSEERYRVPLRLDALRISNQTAREGEFALVGSIATSKYVDPLAAVLGELFVFPVQSVGRGDMSRGGLMLRHAAFEPETDDK